MLEVRNHGSLLEVSGALDARGGMTLLRAVQQVSGDVRVDGSGLERIDGAGLTALVMAQRECREHGRSFALLAVAPDALAHLRARRELLRLFAPPAPSPAPASARQPRATASTTPGREPLAPPAGAPRHRRPMRLLHRRRASDPSE